MSRKKNEITLLEAADRSIITQHTESQKKFALSELSVNQNRDYLHLSRTESADLSLPELIRFSWISDSEDKEFVQVSPVADFSVDCWEFPENDGKVDCKKTAFIHSLLPGVNYFWRIVDHFKEPVSEVREFATAYEIPRYIYIEGVSNVRDIGGYTDCDKTQKVRSGLIYRGGELNSHMTASAAALDFLENNLKIKSILDLRSAEELKDLPDNGHALSSKVKHINIPILAYKQIENPEQQKLYAAAFRAIIQPENLPCYLHCWGGADRTGTFIFLILALLGIDEETILHDYELTSLSIWDIRSRNGEWFKELMDSLRNFSQASDFQTMSYDYFKSCGISDLEIGKLKRIFLTEI